MARRHSGIAGGRERHGLGLAATMVAIVLLLVGATRVFVELKGSLDELWGIEPQKGLAIVVFLRTRLHSFGCSVRAFLLLVSLASAPLCRARALCGRIERPTMFSRFFPRCCIRGDCPVFFR